MIRQLLALLRLRVNAWRLEHRVPVDNNAGYSRLDELDGL